MAQRSFNTLVVVSQPEKIGDGIHAFVRYNLKTTTSCPKFGCEAFEVSRRFREFHALYETLVDEYRPKGIFIPHPPEKSFTVSTKVKIENRSVSEVTQLEQRRLALERFINRVAQHPVLGCDDSLVGFLTSLVCTVKPRDKLLKLANNFSIGFLKLLPDTEDYDQWFEERLERVACLESCLESIISVGSDLLALRREHIASTKRFIQAACDLNGTESNSTVSKAFSAISSLKEQACILYEKMCLNDLHELVGTPKDYMDDIISVKHMLSHYTKMCSNHRTLESKLQNRREVLSKFQSSERKDKLDATQSEIEELEKQVKFSTSQIEEYYSKLKEEMNYFDEVRVREMRTSIIRYMKVWKNCQTQLFRLWESVLPVCQSIQ